MLNSTTCCLPNSFTNGYMLTISCVRDSSLAWYVCMAPSCCIIIDRIMHSMITEDYERVVSPSRIMLRDIRASTRRREHTSDIQDDPTAGNAKRGKHGIRRNAEVLGLFQLSGFVLLISRRWPTEAVSDTVKKTRRQSHMLLMSVRAQ